ncbi:MAG: imidazole glycerol phosphate synthase subunit HisF [Vicinamibacteria bacterium]
MSAVPPGTHPLATRIIARLDIKGPNLVKGIHLEGLRVIGDPAEHAVRYYREGADELIYIDIVASLYGRNSLLEVVEQTASQIFVPLTVGGGVRSLEDIRRLLRAGADKVAINTTALRRPELLTEASRVFGSQAIVLSIEAKRRPNGGWEAYTDNGREKTGVDAVAWAQRGVELGAGEILLTSVDAEGTRRGFDLDLIRAIGPAARVPVIACGGAGGAEHIAQAARSGADGVAIASLLHYRTETLKGIKRRLATDGIEVRL